MTADPNAASKRNDRDRKESVTTTRPPRSIRLPGFVSEEQVGLGDVIKRATSALGIRPCGGCERRAAQLNRRVIFRDGQR
jgi:hypothetical protein